MKTDKILISYAVNGIQSIDYDLELQEIIQHNWEEQM